MNILEKHDKIFKQIGLNIKEERKKAKLTQKELAEKFGGDRSKISDIENGKENFMFSTLLDIADSLKLDVQRLLKK